MVTSDVYYHKLTYVSTTTGQHKVAGLYSCTIMLIRTRQIKRKSTISTFKFDVLPHPPYSPDMALNDLRLLSSLQRCLVEKMLNDAEEIQ